MKRPAELDDDAKNDQELLYELINKKKKFSLKKPKVILTNSDSVEQSDEKEKETEENSRNPIFFVQDLQRVILFSLLGDQFRFYPRWCRILRPKLFKSINLVTINNFSDLDFQLHKRSLRKFLKIFAKDEKSTSSIDFVSASANYSNFFNEFLPVPITRSQWLKIRDG